MFSSDTGAKVDAAAVPQIGCRTLCQYPGCGQPIELVQSKYESHPSWVHLLGARDHEPTPVEPEHPGEQLIARVQGSVDTYRRGRREGLLDLAVQLRGQAGDGVGEFPVALRYAAREAERCAGGES